MSIFVHFARAWIMTIFTGRNEVGARLCFYTCLWFCSQGGSAPLHAGIHPPEQTPSGSRHPHRPGTPPRADTPLEADTPRTRHPPAVQCMLGDTGNKRGVRILLKWILVDHIWSPFKLWTHEVHHWNYCIEIIFKHFKSEHHFSGLFSRIITVFHSRF